MPTTTISIKQTNTHKQKNTHTHKNLHKNEHILTGINMADDLAMKLSKKHLLFKIQSRLQRHYILIYCFITEVKTQSVIIKLFEEQAF